MIGERTGTRGPTMRFLHKCDVCDKEFGRQWNLERHKLSHKESDSDSGSDKSNRGKSMLEKESDSDSGSDNPNRGKSMLERIKNG